MNFVVDVRNHITSAFHSIADRKKFGDSMGDALQAIKWGGIFAGDNLITFHKNLSFLRDERFFAAFSHIVPDGNERALAWRFHTLCWAGERAMNLDGDFVECGSYRGTSARLMVEYLDFAGSDKAFYMYDLFEHSDDMEHHALPEHGAELFDMVKGRFAAFNNVHVTKGRVPEILDEISPDKIAFLHIDMNNVTAEMGALDILFDRVVPGGSIILDDFGWLFYQPQMEADIAFFSERGYRILELPTGQGLVIK